ncbi:hypothetical protein TNCV_2293651 [Trichonephila clavipes]|nr:hypothetical protein TNCV_2293651 [Trichonephila clavipes]
MVCTGTYIHKASTRCHSSSTGVTGVWLQVGHSSAIDQPFSIGEISGERDDQGNCRTSSVSRKVCTIPATCGRALPC